MGRFRRLATVARNGASLVGTSCLLVALAGCTSTPRAAPPGRGAARSATPSSGAGHVPAPPTTEVPAVPPTAPLASCPAGSTPSAAGSAPPILSAGGSTTYCLTTGSSLTLVFRKPSAPGVGKWLLPVRVNGPLRVGSTTGSGAGLTVVVDADAPGSGTVMAVYGVTCVPPTATACTIPPAGTVQANVVVVTAAPTR